MTSLANLSLAAPELLMAAAGLVLLMIGVYQKGDATRLVGWLAVLVMVVAGVLVLKGAGTDAGTTFKGMFVTDAFAVYAKVMVLGASALSLILSLGWLAQEEIKKFEYSVLVLFATLGMLMMVSANDLMSLYIGLELQSLALYVVASFKRDSVKSTEAGLKYFVLGSVASGMMLYGMSMIYGFSGTTNFEVLAEVLSEHQATGVVVGLVFVMAGLAFKVSAAPFHMWTPDVYEGAPTPVTAFFALAPKIAAIALFVRVMTGPFADLIGAWQQVMWIIAVLSMIVGSFGAIGQQNIKRLMAYSSIGHMGYALIGLVVGNEEGVQGILIYLAIYVFMNIGAFAIILSMRQKGRALEGISDLAGLSKTSPLMAAALAIFMFSMAGIPPMAGFFGKFYVFISAVHAGMYWLAVIGVLTSVVGAYYYLRIVKVMYFDEPTEAFDTPRLANRVILLVAGVFTLFYIVYPSPLLLTAQAAAKSLFAY
ncbi:NADH-quinone oxidoreductase subunit NuoN [Insolitispirillum peregrinum]|uniref:NADH-quinone oxidoreductase subunit N n=1 Tax=Insolitispirillum peregrinum TaxID=80876 RepID=A0A1N7IL51_9PROT|nr:NADH-quinone oxidoreductase subunit NuoN [Insolitispirillum peregrinum]SIS37701.1 NADH dehydrogenase subunit N [Insolitispirillum peregrinum]